MSSERTKLLSPASKKAASGEQSDPAKVAAGGQPAAAHHSHGHHGDVAKPVSAIAIALLCFSAQAGGPFGIESAVKAAGALPTIVGLFIAGGLWALPQAFITAELASAIPANGGPVVWTRRAWGTKTSFVVSMLLVSNQIVDLGLYPALVAAYFQQLFPNAITPWVAYAIKIASLVLTVGLNVLGVDALSAAAAVLTVVILTPFVVLPIVAAARGMPFDWSALGPGGIPAEAPNKAALFMTTVLWSMQGWGEIGLLVSGGCVVGPRCVR
jgi:amino acid transporter